MFTCWDEVQGGFADSSVEEDYIGGRRSSNGSRVPSGLYRHWRAVSFIVSERSVSPTEMHFKSD